MQILLLYVTFMVLYHDRTDIGLKTYNYIRLFMNVSVFLFTKTVFKMVTLLGVPKIENNFIVLMNWFQKS